MALYPHPTLAAPVHIEGGDSINCGQFTTSTTARKVVDYNQFRFSILLQNTSSNTIYVGRQDQANSGCGYALGAGQFLSTCTHAELWASSAAGGDTLTWYEEAG